MSGGNGSMDRNTLSQQDWDSSNGDVSWGNDFINLHSLYQSNNPIALKKMYGDVGYSDGSSGYGSTYSHTIYQYNGLKSLINSNNRDDIEMHADFN